MKVAVIQFPGSNSDQDAVNGVRVIGHQANLLWHKEDSVGDADAVIVPDIVSGNTLFKALVYLSGGCAAGLVTGAKVPILLTSRADPPAARIASAALAAISCGLAK